MNHDLNPIKRANTTKNKPFISVRQKLNNKLKVFENRESQWYWATRLLADTWAASRYSTLFEAHQQGSIFQQPAISYWMKSSTSKQLQVK